MRDWRSRASSSASVTLGRHSPAARAGPPCRPGRIVQGGPSLGEPLERRMSGPDRRKTAVPRRSISAREYSAPSHRRVVRGACEQPPSRARAIVAASTCVCSVNRKRVVKGAGPSGCLSAGTPQARRHVNSLRAGNGERISIVRVISCRRRGLRRHSRPRARPTLAQAAGRESPVRAKGRARGVHVSDGAPALFGSTAPLWRARSIWTLSKKMHQATSSAWPSIAGTIRPTGHFRLQLRAVRRHGHRAI